MSMTMTTPSKLMVALHAPESMRRKYGLDGLVGGHFAAPSMELIGSLAGGCEARPSTHFRLLLPIRTIRTVRTMALRALQGEGNRPSRLAEAASSAVA